MVSFSTVLTRLLLVAFRYRCTRRFHFFGAISTTYLIRSNGCYVNFAIARESRKPWPLVFFEVALNFRSGTNESLNPRLWIARGIMGRRENCDLRGFDQLRVGFVHTAIRRHQKPTLLIAELNDRWIFYALRCMLRFVITELICETHYTCVPSLLETFAVRFTESILKKQNARFVVFFDQSGLMPV